MLRIAYAVTVLTLLGASAVTATNIDTRQERFGRGAEFRVLASLQR